MLQDCHAHLQAVSDAEGMERVLSGLKEAGVGRIFCNAVSCEDWDLVRGLSERHKEVVPFYGIHPWFADKACAGWEEKLLKYLDAGPSGLGEIGLDTARAGISLEKQDEVFERQLDIAYTLKKPFALHCVGAWGAVIEKLKAREAGRGHFIAHSFSGSVEVMRELIKLGGYISFSLKIVEKRFKKIGEAFAAVPMDRLLLETDFPYAPGSVSKEPAVPDDYIDCAKRVYKIAAELKGKDAGELEKAVWENGTVFVH